MFFYDQQLKSISFYPKIIENYSKLTTHPTDHTDGIFYNNLDLLRSDRSRHCRDKNLFQQLATESYGFADRSTEWEIRTPSVAPRINHFP